MNFQYSAGAVIYRWESGKLVFLILKRDEGYDLAKGHIEKGESAEEAAKREIKEETGLEPDFLPFFSMQIKYFFMEKGEKVFKTLKLFIAESESRYVRVSDEHIGYLWVNQETAAKKLRHQNYKNVLDAAADYLMRKREIEKINNEYAGLPKKTGKWELSRRLVPGEGRLDARIMLVGQAPGANEDQLLRPFIGRSGRLLDTLLKGAGIDRKKIYIVSVVQFFPPKNRMPTRQEVELCKPFLMRQINLIRPRCIITVGNLSSQILTGIGNVETNHGKVIRKAGISYLITFHPAAALRFPGNVALMRDDLKQIKYIIGKQ